MGADAHRARFHSSMLDTKMLKAKQKFKETEGERRQMCKAMEALDISEEDKERLKKRI